MSASPGAERSFAREVVRLPGRETVVEIGAGVRSMLGERIAVAFPRARRVGLVADRRVHALWPVPALGDGRETVRVLLPEGEAAKTRAVLARVQDRLLALTRDEPVVALGGGALLDVAGFAAATVRRGLPWVALPTTVVGMADASVGGKVAINHRLGKNLLGTFHPPAHVLADVEVLETLEPRDRIAGLAEVYKTARIGDPDLLARLQRGIPASAPDWTRAIHASVAVKARLVERDERDTGARRLLNYGHTVGHALETLLGPERMRHGEAVAIGMGVAVRLARARGLVDGAFEAAQRQDLETLGLPTRVPAGVRADAVLLTLAQDKKRRPGARHTFVLPVKGRGLEVFEDVLEDEIRAALGAA